jgi:prepilin-type N-terminal cleavage/methylation domain-containing protein
MSTSRQSSQNRIWPIRGAAGFTLIEMAIVIIIIGVIISIVSTVLPALIRTSKIKKAQAVLEKVDYALQGYISSNGQLPCPDTDNPQDGLENRIAGTTPPTDDTCAAYVGRLPYATLGLSSATDPWQNVVRYGVYEGLVRTTQTNLCAVLPCSPCLADFVNNPTGAWLSTSDGTTVTNVGYVLASGSAKDLDGDGAFFDGRNATAPATAQFESPNKITDPAYDDILRTGDLTYLQGRLCTGGGGGGGGGSGGNVEVCDDVGVNDEDGDGLANCNDPDCAGHPACVGGTNVIIITPSFPSGTVNDTYATTVQASGGVTPYEWQITDNGGFSSLFLHTYTGQLSGSLNQCPGTYSVTVAVADTTTPTATTDSRGYTIDVASDLTVSRTSGPGTNIDWVSATQEETFQANGGHLGDITWNLTTGGADGFTVAANGSSSAIVKKSGETTTGVGPYTFVLTAEDGSCSGNSAQLIFTVTIPASGSGAAAPYTVGMEAQWRLDECTVWDGSSYDVEDYLGNPLHYGRRIGNVTGVTNGKICRAASFDGASARIVSDVLTGSDIMGFGDAVTLACWFKSPGGGGGYPRLIEFSDAAGRHTRSTAIAYDPDGSLRAWVTSEAGVRGGEIDYSATRYDDNVWHHAVYTYSAGNGGRLYVDGDLKQTGTDDPTSDIHDAETFVIGGYFPDATNGFLGLIDEVAVFQRELTAAEITQLFESTRGSCPGSCYTAPIAEYQMENAPWNGVAGEVYDSGSGGSNGVAAFRGSGALPTQTDTDGGKICRAGEFARVDGSNGGCLDLGDPADGDLDPNTRAWTVTAWVYWDGSSGENIIYNKENLYEARVSGGYVNYAWRPHWVWDGGTAFPVTAGTWTHVATTYEGTEQVLFKDGLPVYRRDETGGSIGSNSSKLLIGARGSGTPYNFFGGRIDEVRIYDRALSHSEILAIVGETRTCP